jgi:hypothetical protein
MKNIIILGSGRSGTSMVAGCFGKAGYFMGENFWKAREANPKGFFEDREVNEINEDLLEPVVPKRRRFLGKTFFKHQPLKWHRWLACLPPKVQIPSTPFLVERIKNIVQRQPFCLKDPRFSYTLPVWKPFLDNTVFICVFRDPARTASSIYRECLEVPHLADPKTGIKISMNQAFKIWIHMYLPILSIHRHQGDWLFLHYNQVLTSEGMDKLVEFTGTKVDRSFPTAKLSRSRASDKAPKKSMELYLDLCKLSGYQDSCFVR